MTATRHLQMGTRRGQVFTLDVLIALVVILLILGLCAQYLFNTESKIVELSSDYELQIVSTDVFDSYIKNENHAIHVSASGECTGLPSIIAPYERDFDSSFYASKCRDPQLPNQENPSSSSLRFMYLEDNAGNIVMITDASLIVWKFIR